MEDKKNVLIVLNSITDQELSTIQESMANLPFGEVNMHLVYVKPRLPTCYFHIPSMVDLASHCDAKAKEKLTAAGNKLNVLPDKQWVAMGRMKSEIMKLAKKLNTSFILAGSEEHAKLSQQFSFRRMNRGCSITAIQDTTCLTPATAHSC